MPLYTHVYMQLCPNAYTHVYPCTCVYNMPIESLRVKRLRNTAAVTALEIYLPHLPWHPKEKSPLMIDLRRRLACRCLITWWIPPQLQLACHLPLCYKETAPNPAHVPWTNGLSPSLWETETIVHRMPRHDRLRQKSALKHQAYSFVQQNIPESQ